MVVHREAEEDDEEEQRQPGGDAAEGVKAQQRLEPAVLKDQHEYATIALIGMTIERNVKSSRTNPSPSSKANTIGACDFIESLKSRDPAVGPVTCASAPSTQPRIRSRRPKRRSNVR